MRRWVAVLVSVTMALALSCSTPEKAGERQAARQELEAVDAPARQRQQQQSSAPMRRPLTTSAPEFSPRRPARVCGNLDVPLRRRWKYIVIHHSGTEAGSRAAFDRFHREERGWEGVGYNFVIGNGQGAADGLVEVTFRWERQMQGAHASDREYNEHGIGICLVGDLESGHPTAAQMEALVGLVNYLQERCDIPTEHIVGHRHIRPRGTRCPGRNFPWYEFYSRLNR